MFLITLMQEEYVNTTVLPDKKKGHYKLNNSISSLEEEINIDGIDNKWVISSGENYTIYRFNGGDKLAPVQDTVIESDDTLIIDIKGIRCTLIVSTVSNEKNKFVKFCLAPDGQPQQTITIGKKPDNDIVLNAGYISGLHAAISRKNNKWYVADLGSDYKGSKNGTYVNNRKIQGGTEIELNIGDVVFIVGYKFIICADFIASNIDFDSSVHGNKLQKVVFPEFRRSDKKPKSAEATDYFYRTIDLDDNKPELKEITLLPPERAIADNIEQTGIATMGSAITMSTASVLVAAYSAVAAYYRGSNMSYVVPSFIMAGSMVMSSLMWPSIMRKKRKKFRRKEEAKRVKDYQEYIIHLRDSVNVMKDNEKKYLCTKYLTADDCMLRVISRDRYLWSKSINDEDFMVVAIGTGKRKSDVVVKCHDETEAFFKDDLRYVMMQFKNEERVIENAPITLSLNNGCICGVSGIGARSSELIKEIVVQLTSLYSYDELKLVFIYDDDEKENWEYAKWLPHVWNSDNTFRYIASTADDIKELSHELEKEIDTRLERKEDDFPKMLIIASDKKAVDSINIMPVIMKRRKELNISLLTSFGMYNYNNSDYIIELNEKESNLYDRENNIISAFEPYHVRTDNEIKELNFEKYLDMISNIKLDISTEKYQLPKMLTFLEMFRVSKVEHLNSLARWSENNPIKSLKTEIGVAPSGDTFFIDMHEKFHGPHGLIAGTTGSGKSESIITVILSLAVNYSPEEVAFVIVDYKGGGLADAFNDVKEEVVDGHTVEVHYKLPHVVGTVTNLDGATIERACISIETELKRRQFLFKTARKISNEGTMDIYKYQQLRREGADLEALPHLFIVCDEFAELKADRQDFMDLLVSAARIGRSLGVHLILATQKPDSVVSPQIWSNSRFKICLKVQGKDDSKAVIHCPDAAEISTTGRFFFQVGYNEVFSMGQSAWCGADYNETEEFIKNDVESLEVLNNTGSAVYEKSRKAEIRTEKKGKSVSQLIAVRNYLIDIAKDIDIRPLWLEPIPAKLSVRALIDELNKGYPENGYVPLEPVIGKRDDLYKRVQEIMPISFSEKGNIIVYGAAGSGLDMFFITLIYSLIYSYSPSQVNIYVLDFDAGFLKTFDKAPQVGDVVTNEDADDVRKVISSIKNEIMRRNKLFAEYRGEYEEYCRHSGETLPNIVLILNNYTEFYEKFNDEDAASLVYIAREGVKRGIYVVVGTSSVNVNFRLRQYIQQIFMLKMNDTNDYLGVLGRTGGITPSECAGSGIIKEDNITYKFQTADIFDILPKEASDDDEQPDDRDAAKEVKMLCESQLAKHQISAASYRTAAINSETVLSEEIDAAALPIGTDEDGAVKYDLSSKYLTFVSSLSEKNLTVYAEFLAKALSRDKNAEVHVLDAGGKFSSVESGYKYYHTLEDFERWNKEYKNTAETRCGMLIKNAEGKIVMGEEVQDIYVIINSFKAAAEIKDKNVTFANLKYLINELPEVRYHYIIMDTPEDMNSVRGAYIHIVKNLTDITDFSSMEKENNREWFDDSGIWLGSGVTKTDFFDIGEARPMISDNEALLIRNRKIEKQFRYFT